MRGKVLYHWGLWIVLVAACSCHGQGRADSKAGQTAADTLQGNVRKLPLPEVPSMLTVPEERAEYIIGHFWDGVDFADTLRSHDRLFMERKLRELPLALPTSKAGGPVSPYRMAVKACSGGFRGIQPCQ